jgi:hypothetical protein
MVYKLLAKLYVNARDAGTQAKQTAQGVIADVKSSIDDKGGVGEVVRSSIVKGSTSIGSGIDKLVQEHDTRAGTVREKATSYQTSLPKLAEIGYNGLVNKVSAGIKYVSGAAKTIATRVNAEIATDDDKRVQIGTHTYLINAATTSECLEVRKYLGQLSKAIPSQTAGRVALLEYVASHAVHNAAQFKQLQAKMPQDQQLPMRAALQYVLK